MVETPEEQIKRLLGKQTVKPKKVKPTKKQQKELEAFKKQQKEINKEKAKTFAEHFETFIIAVLTTIIMSFILAYPVMLFWNWSITPIFSLGVIGYWQAFYLYLLIRFLFK